IETVVRDQLAHMTIEVMERDRDRYAFDVSKRRTSGLQITLGGADYFLEGGLFLGTLEIDGNGVRVFSRNHDEPCDQRQRTVFTGDLSGRGDDVEVYDVGMRGRLIVTGRNHRIHDACDGVWSASR